MQISHAPKNTPSTTPSAPRNDVAPLWERRIAARKSRDYENARNPNRNTSPSAKRRAARIAARDQDKARGLAILRGNRDIAINAGATGRTLQFVECLLSLQITNPRAGFADVARVHKVSRALVSQHMKRARDIYLIFQVGRTIILNVESLMKWDKEGIKRRAESVKTKYSADRPKRNKTPRICKCMNTKVNSGSVKTPLTHIGTDYFIEDISDQNARNQQFEALQLPPHARTAYWMAAQNAAHP